MKSLIRPFIILIVLSLTSLGFALKVVKPGSTWDETVSFVNPEKTKDFDWYSPYSQSQYELLNQALVNKPFWTTSVPQPDTTIPIVVIPATVDTEQTSQLFKAAVKDLNIMCRLFDNQLKLAKPVNTDPFCNIYSYYRSDQYFDLLQGFWGRKIRNTNCIYIEGYGALFLMRVNIPLTASPKPVPLKEKPSEPIDKVWRKTESELYGSPNVQTEQPGKGYDIDAIEEFKKNIVKTLKHAANIQCLKSDDLVIVTVSGPQKKAGPPRVLVVRAKKSDIDEFSKGTLDLDSFREKVQIIAPPQSKHASVPEKATGKPNTSEGTEE